MITNRQNKKFIYDLNWDQDLYKNLNQRRNDESLNNQKEVKNREDIDASPSMMKFKSCYLRIKLFRGNYG